MAFKYLKQLKRDNEDAYSRSINIESFMIKLIQYGLLPFLILIRLSNLERLEGIEPLFLIVEFAIYVLLYLSLNISLIKSLLVKSSSKDLGIINQAKKIYMSSFILFLGLMYIELEVALYLKEKLWNEVILSDILKFLVFSVETFNIIFYISIISLAIKIILFFMIRYGKKEIEEEEE